MIVGKKTLAVCKWKELLEVDEWAEKYFVLEESSAVGGGKWSFKLAPHLRTPLKSFGMDNISNINLWFSAQGGKSTLSYVMINYIIDRYTGSNIGFYLPNDQLVPYTATNRILPSIKRIPENAKLLSETKSNNKLKDNSRIIRLAGGVLRIMGAESSINRKSFPAQYIFLDEIAEMKHEHVMEVEERNKTFSSFGGKIVKLSTSLTKNDPITKSHDDAECQMEYFSRCPSCGKKHIDDFINNIVFPEDIDVNEDFDEKTKEVYIKSYKARNALYRCPHCKVLWNTDEKNKAVTMGEWIAVRGSINKDSSVSFRASSFVSHFVSLEDLSRKYLDVQDATDEIKSKFYNGWLSKIYEPEIETTKEDEIWNLKCEIQHETVPNNVVGLVGAIDWQKDHYYGLVLAIDEDMNKIITEYQRIETKHDLESFILRPRYKQNGELINIEAWANDSGYNSGEVYDFCYDMNTLQDKAYNDDTITFIFDKRGGEVVNCVPVRGSSRSTSTGMAGISQITTIEKNLEGKVYEDSMKLHVINTYMYKAIASKLIEDSISKKREKNLLKIHKDMDDKICEALTSEYKKELPNGAFQFVPTKSHPFNHYWDCLIYCLYLSDKLEIRHRELISKDTIYEIKRENEEKAKRRQRRYDRSWANQY